MKPIRRRQTQDARLLALKEAARAIVRTGTCPQCGTTLVPNLAILGWWQCGAFGEPPFRRPEFRDVAHCSFQTFTE